eukprot:g923.t1
MFRRASRRVLHLLEAAHLYKDNDSKLFHYYSWKAADTARAFHVNLPGDLAFCLVCSIIQIPGINCTVRLNNRKGVKRKRKNELVYTCQVCNFSSTTSGTMKNPNSTKNKKKRKVSPEKSSFGLESSTKRAKKGGESKQTSLLSKKKNSKSKSGKKKVEDKGKTKTNSLQSFFDEVFS